MMHKKRLFIPLLIITIICLAVPLGAKAESGIIATLSADAGEFTVGDPIPLTLTVTHPAGYQVILPQLDPDWGDFTVRSQSAGTTESNSDGTESTSQVIDVRLFAPGTFTTSPFPITVSDGNGQLSEINVDPISLSISSVLVEGDSELRDIKPQAALPYVNLIPWVVGIGLLALGVTGAILWYRRKQKKLSQAMIDNRLPHEVALDELERVETLNLPESGRFKQHYTLVSDCIRVYMEKTFHFPVLERTTGEIKFNLKRTRISPEIANQFVLLLDESDLVKFSKFKPDMESANLLLSQGRLIVESTKPVIVEPTTEDQDPSQGIPPDPKYGKNGRNQQAEVTA